MMERSHGRRSYEKKKTKPNYHILILSLCDIRHGDNDIRSGLCFFGTTRSEYLRKLLTEKKIYNNVEIVADIKLLRELVGQYGKIGSNLNQIAKYFNTGGQRSLEIQEEIQRCIWKLFQHAERCIEDGR